MITLRREVRAWLPVVIWALCIWLIGGSSNVPQPPVSFFGIDKVAHFCMYGLLAALIARATFSVSSLAAVIAVLVAVALGAADEMRQLSVATRSGDPYDFVADITGITVGYLFGRRMMARHDKLRR